MPDLDWKTIATLPRAADRNCELLCHGAVLRSHGHAGASAGVARRLRFDYLGETPDEATAPGEIGIDCAWRIDRDVWRVRA